MNFLRFTRYIEWWEYKLPPLLSVAYATIIYLDLPIDRAIWRILLLLLAIIAGAVYVSVINDLTDIREDLLAGKPNSMSGMHPYTRIIILAGAIASGLCFSYLLFPDWRTIFFYGMAFLAFSLYSIRPFRFKERGILGVACDAMGAHLFPSLVVTSNLIFLADSSVNVVWLLSISCWSFLYGLRGILWHQFHDRENDLKSGTKTYATGKDPKNFRNAEIVIFGLELVSFATFLSYFINVWVFVALLLYLILVLVRVSAFNREVRIIVSSGSQRYQLLMNDFYIVFFPPALLITISTDQAYGWIILCFHLLIFPMNTLAAIKEYTTSFKLAVSRL